MRKSADRSLRLVQLIHPTSGRCVAVVEEPSLRRIAKYESVYALAMAAIAAKKSIAGIIGVVDDAAISYDEVYAGKSDFKLLPAFDIPDQPSRDALSPAQV